VLFRRASRASASAAHESARRTRARHSPVGLHEHRHKQRTQPLRCRGLGSHNGEMAEGEGFEPPVPVTRDNGFQDGPPDRRQPLWEPDCSGCRARPRPHARQSRESNPAKLLGTAPRQSPRTARSNRKRYRRLNAAAAFVRLASPGRPPSLSRPAHQLLVHHRGIAFPPKRAMVDAGRGRLGSGLGPDSRNRSCRQPVAGRRNHVFAAPLSHEHRDPGLHSAADRAGF
jgi:hypothetical protein